MRTVKRFRGREVHRAFPQVHNKRPTGKIVVVYAAPKGFQREREIVTAAEYEAEKTIETRS